MSVKIADFQDFGLKSLYFHENPGIFTTKTDFSDRFFGKKECFDGENKTYGVLSVFREIFDFFYKK